MTRYITKLFLVLTLVLFYSFFATAKADAWAPAVWGRVKVGGTSNTGVVGIWIKWVDRLGNVRYAKTDENGRYDFASWSALTYAQKSAMYNTRIDTNLDGTMDSRLASNKGGTAVPYDAFGCVQDPHSFSVIKPYNWLGTFSSVTGYVLDNNLKSERVADMFFYADPGTCGGLPCPTVSNRSISGTLFFDTNHNGQLDSGEAGLSSQGVNVVSLNTGQSTAVDATGKFTFNNLAPNTYTLTLNVAQLKQGPYTGSLGPWTCTPNCKNSLERTVDVTATDASNQDFGVYSFYGLTGKISIDTNNNSCSDSLPIADGAYNLTLTDSFGSAYTATTASGGNYSYADLPKGTFSFSISASGYSIKTVVDGNGHAIDLAALKIENDSIANFCLSNLYPWYQTTTGDVRMPNIVNYTPSYGSSDPSSPGVFLSSAGNSVFSPGAASAKQWAVENEYSFNKKFENARGLVSYTYYLSRAKQTNTTINNVSCTPPPGGGNCKLNTDSTAIQNGVNEINGNVDVEKYVHNGNNRVILLVNGSVTIKKNIDTVPSGGLFILAAKDGIIIDEAVGTSVPSDTTVNLGGIYSSEKSITLSGTRCATGIPDKKINVGGALIANSLKPFASNQTGKVNIDRSLCANDKDYPVLTVQSRIDFIPTLTDFYKEVTHTWRENR